MPVLVVFLIVITHNVIVVSVFSIETIMRHVSVCLVAEKDSGVLSIERENVMRDRERESARSTATTFSSNFPSVSQQVELKKLIAIGNKKNIMSFPPAKFLSIITDNICIYIYVYVCVVVVPFSSSMNNKIKASVSFSLSRLPTHHPYHNFEG